MKVFNSGGFTIIETMLVLAISGLLLMIGFFGQGQIKKQTQFTDSVENFVADLEKFKAEGTRTVGTDLPNTNTSNCASSAIGQNKDCIKFGVVVDFSDYNPLDDRYTYHLYDIYADRLNSGASIDPAIRVRNPRIAIDSEITTKWGVKISGSPVSAPPKKIAFIRHSGNGRVETHALNQGANITSNSSYSDATLMATLSVIVTDDQCNAAQIDLTSPVEGRSFKIKYIDRLPTC